MTSHSIDREEVMAYVDGALDPNRSAEVEGHLHGCADCRTLADELRLVSARMSAWRMEDAPARFVVPVPSVEAAATRSNSWWAERTALWFPRWALAGGLAAVAIAVVTIAQVTFRSRTSSESALARVEEAERSDVPRDRATIQVGTASPAEGVPLSGPAQRAQALLQSQSGAGGGASQATDRMIIRSAAMLLTSDRFDQIRAELERLVAAEQGRMTSMNVSGDPSSRRSLRATIGVPAARLETLLAGLRRLGRVQEESLSSDDVTESFRDLGIRTANARKEEQRLVELLTRRTGDLSDVLAVEREIARVRLEIERMEAETRGTSQRVALASVTLTIQEQYRAELAIGSLPLNVRLKNAFVDGVREAAGSLLATSLFVLQVAPLLIVWALLLFLPARWAWRRASTAISRG